MAKQMGEPMTIEEAINTLTDSTLQANLGEKSKVLIELAVEKLKAMQTLDVEKISEGLQELIEKTPSSRLYNKPGEEPYKDWAEKVYIAAYTQSRFRACEKYLGQDKKIDGETSQWWTTVVQGILGMASIVIAVLIGLKVIPNPFGSDGDSLYYIIGTVGQQCVAVLMGVIVGIINKRHIKNMYADSEYKFEELMAAKYSDSNGIVRALLPQNVNVAIKNNGNINSPGGIVIHGCFNRVD